jgi:hypothetical protein
MKIKSNIFFDSLEANIEKQIDGIEADVNLFPCDLRTLYGVDTFISDYDVHMIPSSNGLFGCFKCELLGAVDDSLIATTICCISCDFEDAANLGKIITGINRALEDTVADFKSYGG